MNRTKTIIRAAGIVMITATMTISAAETLVFDQPETAGMSGLRAHWDQPLQVAEDGKREQKDGVVKDRGQSAVWNGKDAGPLAFDAVHRHLLVRFPGAAERIAEALAAGKAIEKVELVLPYLDEELWPTGSGGADFPSADGYRYRMNWDVDKMYRESRPNWHAVAWLLRKPWAADTAHGPTYNAAINGAAYWKRFGASDTTEDRFPAGLGPAEVSSYKPDGRMDVTAVLADPAFGKTLAQRLRALADCGFVVSKQEVYDSRFFPPSHCYEWATSTGPRAILIKRPQLVVTLKPGKAEKVDLAPPADIKALAATLKDKPDGAPTAVIPGPEEVARLNEKFMAKPDWMPDWQYGHVKQLMSLRSGGKVEPFYYRLLPQHVINKVGIFTRDEQGRGYIRHDPVRVYEAWIDWMNGQPPRWWNGHLTAADDITAWYNFREAIPAPVQDSILRCWNAWLMPDRETELDPKLRRQCDNFSGKLVHPMVDDPRVGKFSDGKPAEWNQGNTYYKKTGDWRGNKSFYRSGFTREMSTANFNSGASSGALLCGQIIGSEHAMADGRAGLMRFPFWMWTHSAGVGQEYIDHYYWAIATAGNKVFPDFCEQPEDRMAGWSIIEKTVNDLAGAWHPNLKKLIGPSSRTYYEHVLGQQDGLYHILHALSPRGALSDTDSGQLPALSQDPGKAISAWGRDYPPATVALQTMSGPWAAPWFAEMVDEKPLPWSLVAEKEGDPVTTWFGENYGLSSIRSKAQRIHVLGHWRRKAELPKSMTDIGTLDLRIGFNQTTVGSDLEGLISQQGVYRCYQSANRLILLARPQPKVIQERAGECKIGQQKHPAEELKSVQCSAALFSYEQPRPAWEIFVDGRKVTALPATARYGQVITIRDGVSYIALRPLPTDDLGRDAEITLEAGSKPQTQAYHEQTKIQPALFVHANFYRRNTAIPADALKKLENAQSGFVVEMGDEKAYGSFRKFQSDMHWAKLSANKKGAVTYQTGKDTLVASWDGFTVNGKDPCADLKERRLWQDTTLTQIGHSRLEKNGAVIERGSRHPEIYMFLQTFPKQKIHVATNPTPCHLDYSFSEPGGVKIRADGALSMGRWAVKDSREIDVKYHAFGGDHAPKEPGEAATVLFVTGSKDKPLVTLNGTDVTGTLKAWKQNDENGWLVPLTGTMPTDAELTARLGRAGTRRK
jgi:hypothetical protein